MTGLSFDGEARGKLGFFVIKFLLSCHWKLSCPEIGNPVFKTRLREANVLRRLPVIAWAHLGWLAFAVIVIFAQLGQRGLNEPDEGRYAEIAREMNVDGDWLVPHMNGIPHVQKPPLIYWLTALSLETFGRHEWSARLPSALAALGTVILTFLSARRLFRDADRAVVAALVLTTSAGFFAMSRLLTPDMTMSFWITAAITSALYRKRWWYFILMGLGFMTKGPMALVVPLFAIGGWELFSCDADKIRLPWFRGLILTLLISLSWFLVLSWKEPALFEYFWKNELVNRVASGAHGRAKPFWFFFALLPLITIPWVVFIPWKSVWMRCLDRRLSSWQALLFFWFAGPLLILSVSGSKLPTYILPLMPAFALLIAAAFPNIRKAWHIAVASAVLLILGDHVLCHFDEYLGIQASSRHVVELLKQYDPDAAQATFFCCETRTQGIAFYLDRVMQTTRNECDCILPPTPEQSLCLFQSVKDCVDRMTDGPPAHGLVKKRRFQQMFDPTKWRVIAEVGPYLLIANHPAHSERLAMNEGNRERVAN